MDLAALGALVVNVADSELLAAVVAAVRSWLAGLPGAASSWSSAAMPWSWLGCGPGAAAAGRWMAADRHTAGRADPVDGTGGALIVASDEYTESRGCGGCGPRPATPGRWRACCGSGGSAASRCARCSPSLAHVVNLAVEEFFADRRPGRSAAGALFLPRGQGRGRWSCISRRRTPCWGGWARRRWQRSSSAGG